MSELQESFEPTWKWLESTYALQSEVYGYDLEHLQDDPGIQANYIGWNQVAAVQELAELREEFSWKPWATDEPFVNRERAISEIVDCMHFLGNILVGMGVSDKEFEVAYRQKQEKNRLRQASGNYSAKKGGLAHGSDL